MSIRRSGQAKCCERAIKPTTTKDWKALFGEEGEDKDETTHEVCKVKRENIQNRQTQVTSGRTGAGDVGGGELMSAFQRRPPGIALCGTHPSPFTFEPFTFEPIDNMAM